MSDAQASSETRGPTRRRVLKIAGSLGVGGALGLAGWTGRVLYLHGEHDRTGIGTEGPIRSTHTDPAQLLSLRGDS
jgi:hypothetical protein